MRGEKRPGAKAFLRLLAFRAGLGLEESARQAHSCLGVRDLNLGFRTAN